MHGGGAPTGEVTGEVTPHVAPHVTRHVDALLSVVDGQIGRNERMAPSRRFSRPVVRKGTWRVWAIKVLKRREFPVEETDQI